MVSFLANCSGIREHQTQEIRWPLCYYEGGGIRTGSTDLSREVSGGPAGLRL